MISEDIPIPEQAMWKCQACGTVIGEIERWGMGHPVESSRPDGTPNHCGPVELLDPVCHAGTDGECSWDGCPQNYDGEPEKSGRFCPFPHWTDDPEY